MRLSTVVLDAPNGPELAAFYSRLLGWKPKYEEPEWVLLGAPNGGTSLSFQTVSHFKPPVWPEPQPGDQSMMLHLDIEVQDLQTAVAHALAAGAKLADFQPQEDVRVFFDPAGHPFCLWVQEQAGP